MYARLVRVGLVCPYSLSLPGGVQGQVLGLARALRGLGHQVRVLGPCDGAPPEVGITPLGNSVPTAANGSMAPVAPDPSLRPAHHRRPAATRTSTSSTSTSRSPPGCTVTTLVCSSAPMVGTFHAAGDQRLLPVAGARSCARWPHGSTIRCAVSEDARELAQGGLGGEYVLLHNGIEVERFTKATPWPTEGPTVLFLSRHEQRKGLDVLIEALPAARRRPGLGGQRRPRDRPAQGRGRRRPPGRVAGPHRRGGEGPPARGAPTCSAPRRCGASPSG